MRAAWFVLLLAACAAPMRPARPVVSDDLLLKESHSLRSRTDLCPEDVQCDIDVLLHALEHGYGGRKYIDQAKFARALDALRSIRANAARFSDSASLRDAIDEVLLELPDNHLHARTLDGDGSKKREAAHRKGGVGKNVGKAERKTWSLHYREVGGKRVPVLSILELPPGEDDSWKGFLEAVTEIVHSAPALVIDYRGNGGGADTMPEKLAAILFGAELPSHPGRITSETPETCALSVNNARLRMRQLAKRNEPVPAWAEERVQRRLREYQECLRAGHPAEVVTPPSKGAPPPTVAFAKPIFLLIDAECASSCESGVEAFEQHPNAVTVGENTSGSVHFGNMGVVVLPNSQIIVQMATDFWNYADGRYVERVGYAPKIRVASGEDALDVALKKFDELARLP